MNDYRILRFITREQYSEGVELYHLARTALSDKPYSEQSKYCRVIWACKELHKKYPNISETAFYKDLSDNILQQH